MVLNTTSRYWSVTKVSLDENLLEQHVFHLGWPNRDVDAGQQLFTQSVDSRRTSQVIDTQFAQVDLKIIDDPRAHLFDVFGILITGQFKTDVDFQECRSARIGIEIDQHLGQVEEHRFLESHQVRF